MQASFLCGVGGGGVLFLDTNKQYLKKNLHCALMIVCFSLID